ncbi:MAG: Crp/Fnr family transcriptional regulator [Tissierellia bacterium]|nr:Crp/Fnr family transcriptional regulator [Tissierellia bacterium]
MDEIVKVIKNNVLFKNMNEEEIKTVLKCSNAVIENFGDQQILFERDTKVSRLGIVIEGELNLVSHKYNGTRVIVTTLEKNDLFGEALIFSTTNFSPYDLVSSGNSKALLIPYRVFSNMCSNSCTFHNQLITNMLTILSDKIVMLNSKMRILNGETLKDRIAIYLLSLHKRSNSKIFDLPMNRQELAEFLNVKRPSLSRELSNMQRENIIEIYRSTVKILNIEKLRQLAD